MSGLDQESGETFHTGTWPHRDVDFEGKRVGVIGTGLSRIQVIPMIAKRAKHLHVFQRTPNFSLPARNGSVPPGVLEERLADYRRFKTESRQHAPIGESAIAADPSERELEFECRWQLGGNFLMGAYRDILTNQASNDLLADFVRGKIRGIVAAPAVAALLSPLDHAIGTMRICVDTDYYDTFNRPNVTLVDVRHSPITGFTENGLLTADAEYASTQSSSPRGTTRSAARYLPSRFGDGTTFV